MATAALLDGNVGPLPLKLPTDRFVDDNSIEAAAAVECDVTAFSRCNKTKNQYFSIVFSFSPAQGQKNTYRSW